jgi:hypothetical protein
MESYPISNFQVEMVMGPNLINPTDDILKVMGHVA